MTANEQLIAARARYAAAPSHAHPDEDPLPGTFCVVTAFGDNPSCRAFEALRAAAPPYEFQFLSLIRWNYERDTATVLAAFDRAIEATA
jgi:hypothetical protein